METIDWSKAPEDAEFAGTVRGVQVQAFYKNVSGDSFEYCYVDDYGWSGLVYGEPYCKPLIPRPKPQWNGEGLPPVGCMVRVIDSVIVRYGANEEGPVVAHVEDCAVVRMSYGLGCFTPAVLQPIRTPEQIAADERDAACEEMLKIARSRRKDPDAFEIIGALYDAGYRKQEQPK